MASKLRESGFFDEIGVAFHQGSPVFAEALDALRSSDITVVPVMASSGYYANTVLPRELARNRRCAGVRVRRTEPVGCHAGLPAIVAGRIHELLDSFDVAGSADEGDVSLALIGHGSPRHNKSRDSTLRLGDALRSTRPGWDVHCAFLDDEPPVESVVTRCAARNVMVIPFLIGCGPHATADIPRRLGLPRSMDRSPPRVDRVGDRAVACDVPVGAYPEIVDMILDLALGAPTPTIEATA
jgi:sirohydrochlorin cobaltochelatase